MSRPIGPSSQFGRSGQQGRPRPRESIATALSSARSSALERAAADAFGTRCSTLPFPVLLRAGFCSGTVTAVEPLTVA